MALYVKFAEQKRPDTVRKFIKRYYAHNRMSFLKGEDTYGDKECSKLHCDKNYRSFDDLEELVKTYYPSVKTVRILEVLLTTDYSNGQKQMHPHLGICADMGRIRFIPYCCPNYSSVHDKMLKSKFTWNELLIQLGINNRYEFDDYIKTRK